MYCYRSSEVRQSSESVTSPAFTWKFRTHLAKRAFRLVPPRFGGGGGLKGKTRLRDRVYKHDPSNQLRETSLASLLRKLLSRTFAAFFFISLLLELPVRPLPPPPFPPLRSPFRPQYLFCLDRSTRSLTHSGSCYTARDRPDTLELAGASEFGSRAGAANATGTMRV